MNNTPRNLWEQMSDQCKIIVASLLGFSFDSPDDRGMLGFKLNMREIPALPEGFTVGDAYRAYLRSLCEGDSQNG